VPYTVFGKRYYPLRSAAGFREVGEATWYGKKFHGRKTSSGEIYDMYKMTAAHKTLPLPTYVRVRRLDTDETVVVRVNDRGPFLRGRIIDLSYAAARRLDLVAPGKAKVEVVAIDIFGQQSLPKKTGILLEAARFRLAENAETLRRHLLKKKLGPVDIIPDETEGVVYYRVRIGPIAKDQSVDRYILRIQAETGVTPRKVSE
jgi:rare lipoprotein A